MNEQQGPIDNRKDMQEEDLPRVARRFLSWYCPDSLYEGIIGDLLEAFRHDAHQHGIRQARRRFTWQVIRFFHPEIVLRNKFTFTLFQTTMTANYLKVASRNMMKRKLYSFINAFGLSIGIAFCILIFLFMQDEKSFDQFHANKDHLYRIEARSFDTWRNSGEYETSPWIQSVFAPTLRDELAEVQYITRYNPDYRGIFRYGDHVFTENFTYVDPDFFRMFSFTFIKGNPESVLKQLNDVVITPAIASKYFGDEDPIGKTVTIDVEGPKAFTVSGIIEPAPGNSSLHYEILIRQENKPYYESNLKQWGSFSSPTFVQLTPNTDLKTFKEHLDVFTEKYMGEKLKKWRAESAVPIPEDAVMLEYVYTPLIDMHLKKEVSWEKVSDPMYSWILGGIALLILLIAAINYISLSLTTSASRRTEVGIRKAVGAQRGQLIYQFGFESMLLALVSMIIGWLLVIVFLPAFNQFTNKTIQLTANHLIAIAGVSLLITVVVGLLAGSYPSLFLSRFKPALVLKGHFTSRVQAGFTKPLVVLQFILSAFLIISSIIMYRQMNYIANKNLGFDKEHILVIPTQTGWNEEANKTVQRFRDRARNEPVISAVSGTSSSFNRGYSRYGYKIKDEQKSAFVYAVDPDYLPLLNIELIAGRNFDPAIASDSSAVIVNEALVKDMKWTDPLNEYLNWREDTVGLGSKVIGVTRDYHIQSLEQEIQPLLLSMDKENVGYLTNMLVKVSSSDMTEAIEKVRSIWRELNPDRPFDYSFMDEDVARQYESSQRWLSIMGLSTGFAMVISCLGLFGLAGINAVNRTKEIGIRKVMGAELKTIFFLLNKQYIVLAMIAFSIGIPASWYVMDKWWLSSFKFRVAMGWELFVMGMAVGLLVALATVSYHAIKAALVNPAQTLKYE